MLSTNTGVPIESIVTPQSGSDGLAPAYERNKRLIKAGQLVFEHGDWSTMPEQAPYSRKELRKITSFNRRHGVSYLLPKSTVLSGIANESIGKGTGVYHASYQSTGVGYVTVEPGSKPVKPNDWHAVRLERARTMPAGQQVIPGQEHKLEWQVKMLGWRPNLPMYTEKLQLALTDAALRPIPDVGMRGRNSPTSTARLNFRKELDEEQDAIRFARLAVALISVTYIDDRKRVMRAILRALANRANVPPVNYRVTGQVWQSGLRGEWRESGSNRVGEGVIVNLGAPRPPMMAYAGPVEDCAKFGCCTHP